MKILLATLLYLSLNLITTNIVFAQTNPDAFANINDNLDRIEVAITSLTSQTENNNHAHKLSQNKIETELKMITQEINSLKNKVAIQEMEVQNIKNIVNMLINQRLNATPDIPFLSHPAIPMPIDAATPMPIDTASPMLMNTDLLLPIIEQPDPNAPDELAFTKAITQFNSNDFATASQTFANNIKQFPQSDKFHSNLLYLGLSLKELKIKNNACSAFAQILNSQEDISVSIREKAKENYYLTECNIITNDN